MSELSIDPPEQEESDEIEESSSSSAWLMTMVLLIAGFLLTGTMMLYYSSNKTGAEGEKKASAFNLSALLGKGKEYTEQLKKARESAPAAQTEEVAKSTEEKRNKLFGNRSDKVNWPKLKLTGFGSSSSGGGDFAIINGSKILQGQLIDGKAKLTEIRSHVVVVEYKGETKTLSVDIKD